MRRVLKVDCQGDVRRLSISLDATLHATGGGYPEDFREAFDSIEESVRAGYGFLEIQEISLKYRDEEGDLCTLTPMTTEDFLRPSQSQCCAEELAPLRLVAFAWNRSSLSSLRWEDRESRETKEGYESKESGGSLGSDKDNSNPLRSLAPVAVLACLKGMYCSGRLSSYVLASLALQFLPILAQRVQRKQEKINRKGVKLRQKRPVLQLLRRMCEQLERIPEFKASCQALRSFVVGADTGHLGDSLAELLRCLASCKSRTQLAAALVEVADEVLVVLPCLFPETFVGPASPSPCGALAAAIVGAPVHEGFTCAACRVEPIVGPRFELVAGKTSLCGECFMQDSVRGRPTERNFACRLAPKGYDAEAALDDSPHALDAQRNCLSPPPALFPGLPLATDAASPWSHLGPANHVVQLLQSAAFERAAVAGAGFSAFMA